MLEEIRKIDWAKYRHAYGPATDVPDMLKRLYTDIEITDAWDDFEYSVFHQNNFYSVSPIVIPFIIDLACYSAYQEYSIELLWNIAWYPNAVTPEEKINLAYKRENEHFQEKQRSHHNYGKLAQEAVFQGKKAYLELLDEPYDEFYPHLLALLTLCEDEGGDIHRKIETHFKQTDNEIERATCLYSFGLIDFEKYQHEIENAIKNGSKIEQFIGLLMAIMKLERDAPVNYFTKILGLISELKSERFKNKYVSIPFTLGTHIELGRCFSSLDLEQRTPYIEMLLQERDVFIADLNVPQLMLMTFEDNQIIPPVDSLNKIQKKVLYAVARRIWPDGKNINRQHSLLHLGFVKIYGFPNSAKEMEEYFGGQFI